jgi:hypothetical protein
MKYFTILMALTVAGIDCLAQGSCGSEDGGMLEIASPPPNYQYLEDNGYCINGTGNTNWHFMCFTLTPDVSDISINMGYTANCMSVGTKDYELYDAGCVSVGTGLTYTGLTPGSDYTFCVNMRANGGPLCLGFERICPYWIASPPLPIELLYFECDEDLVTWVTASEINNDRYELYSNDTLLHTITVDGNSSIEKYYYYKLDKCKELVELIQIDFNGTRTSYGIEQCDCPEEIELEIIGIYTLLGQSSNGNGIYIVKYSDGSTKINLK